MNKAEVLEYVSNNYEIPEEALQFLNDVDFCIKLLEVEPSVIDSFPIEIQRKVLLIDNKYIDYAIEMEELFRDETFAKQLVDKDNDVLLKLSGLKLNNNYIKKLTIAYIKGEKTPVSGSKLEKLNTRKLYLASVLEVREDKELSLFLLNKNINFLPDIKNKEISENPVYIIEYVKNNPWHFPKYLDKISEHLTPELIEIVLKHDFKNYKLIDRDNPLMQTFYSSIDRIKEIRPEFSMDNPNLRYELLCNPEIITKMDINILNSLLEYSTGNVDKVIDILNNGNLQYLLYYIEQYNKLYGNTLENIQNAISSYENVEELLINTNALKDIELDETKLKTIIKTGNKFNITDVNEILNYDQIVKEYYLNRIQTATTAEEVKEIYAEMLFNSSRETVNKFYEEFCNCNIDEMQEYASKHSIEMPLSEDFKKRKMLLDKIKNIDSIEELKLYFDEMPLELTDLEEAKQAISIMYTKGYIEEMIDLNDENLERTTYEGIDVINLNGQNFNIFIHRIFNFDFDMMNSITNKILTNPEQWTLSEGSNTVSTTFINDKKIAALFRPLKKSKGMEWIKLDDDKDIEEYNKKKTENSIQLYEGEVLQEIEPNAVFYGFTEPVSNGIIKMDSSDIMVEHGKGHLQANSSHCKMRSSEDLAYWTRPDYWNEVAQKRKETNIDKAIQLRNLYGTDRMLPSCIICFDGNINEQSILAARTHNVPILMIDRQKYLDINKQKLSEAKQNFEDTLSPEYIKEIFYRQPYYKIVKDMPSLIDTIKNSQTVSKDNKKITLEYLGYLVQHFIEQSSDGYIINTPVEEYNKQMQQHLQSIDLELQRITEELVTISDMENAYLETSAIDRKRRYESLRRDIQMINSKESEIVNE